MIKCCNVVQWLFFLQVPGFDCVLHVFIASRVYTRITIKCSCPVSNLYRIQSTVEFVKCLGVSGDTGERQELLNWKVFEGM